jgi:hypothetical protein
MVIHVLPPSSEIGMSDEDKTSTARAKRAEGRGRGIDWIDWQRKSMRRRRFKKARRKSFQSKSQAVTVLGREDEDDSGGEGNGCCRVPTSLA